MLFIDTMNVIPSDPQVWLLALIWGNWIFLIFYDLLSNFLNYLFYDILGDHQMSNTVHLGYLELCYDHPCLCH